jgi:hypothetical protein
VSKEWDNSSPHQFAELIKLNVNDHIERKNGLAYLSWPYAVGELMKADPSATWTFGEPKLFSETMMVFCTVVAFGKPITMQLPVMDYRNKAIPNPDAFSVNTAMQRCLVKAIACHGIGLYIYAGEDLPEGETEVRGEIKAKQTDVLPWLRKVKDILAKDVDSDAHCLELYDIHEELNKDTTLYIAVADALSAANVISKANWKASINKGRELARRAA